MEAKQWTDKSSWPRTATTRTPRAVLNTRDGQDRLEGTGHARRNQADPAVPEIGDELAASRALAGLAGKLAVITQRDITELARPAAPGVDQLAAHPDRVRAGAPSRA
ncbi:dsRBD fold-containing protein [Nonomuraea rubra]|uniref:dsRBD fold-containing protein n=1 Tax=Nonomuraea rubra TaxID=46180 RepID=UPI0033BFFCAB